MEISQLQSIIKRQGNEIASHEFDIAMLFDYAKRVRAKGKYPHAEEAVLDAHKLKRKLKKLVSLQKALKKEIAFEIECTNLEREFGDDDEFLSMSGLPTWLLGQAQ